ncbi:hypothetical protein DEA8626_00910 [Defluviimonas aquaemixtae]|uniref:Nucleotide-diphospho-sugar transferase domain-containing protein n=2 Tax=Albidovulum aquaemixtae TaxID=1542388 RepID=A0A2R8B480_9RHOB|nr:hypothetical protein DEA8626_00910 [Defluviimonas aquaemixtae]
MAERSPGTGPETGKDMTEANRRPVASLWIGPRLHYLNQLCLKSHVDQGHPTTLYVTDDVQDAPEGVEIRPAAEIMDLDMALVARTSASFLSNVFRYKMIRKTGAIWIDCDAFCHRPFPDGMDYVFGEHGLSGALNCGVIGLPQRCEVMDQLLNYYDNLPDYPEWWNKRQRKKMDKQPDKLSHAAKIYATERTAFGPQAFTHFARVTGIIKNALPRAGLYPVPFQLNDVFFDPYGRVEGHFTDETLSVHLYTNGTRRWWRKHVPPPGSYAFRMCEQVGIDPSLALEE